MRAKQSKTFRGLRPSAPNGRQGLRNPERGYRFEIIIGALAGDPVQFNSHCDHWPFERYVDDGVAIAQAYCCDGASVEMPAAPNCQHLQPYFPGDPSHAALEHIVACAFKLPDGLQTGQWKLALWLPDARATLRYRSEYAVRLANELAWLVDQDGRGLNVIGEVAVK